MKKLGGTLVFMALTFFALASEVRGTSCTKPIHCPAIRDCQLVGCIDGTCVYDCI
jgi:hypothetical protein